MTTNTDNNRDPFTVVHAGDNGRAASHDQLVMIAHYRDRLIRAGQRDEVIDIYEHVFGLNAIRAVDARITALAAMKLLYELKRQCSGVGA